jgi:HTH-type transcriptional regulator/antitoxin HipB
MGAINETLRHDLLQREFSEGYAESFQDAYLAAQLKVLREQNGWTQRDLARKLDTTQTAISRIENVNYSAWNISTLKKLARAFRVRLKVSFETYGSLIRDIENFSKESLQRTPRESDPELAEPTLKPSEELVVASVESEQAAEALPKRTGNIVVSTITSGNQAGIGARSWITPVGNNSGGIAHEKGLISGNNSAGAMPASCQANALAEATA